MQEKNIPFGHRARRLVPRDILQRTKVELRNTMTSTANECQDMCVVELFLNVTAN